MKIKGKRKGMTEPGTGNALNVFPLKVEENSEK